MSAQALPQAVQDYFAAIKALGTLNDKETAQFLVETVLRGGGNVTQRLSDAAADALVEMTGLSQYGRDFGQWNQWWADQRDKSPAQFLDERRAERERRFGQANAALRNLGSGIDKLMFDLYRQQKDDKEREMLILRLLKDPNGEIIAAATWHLMPVQ